MTWPVPISSEAWCEIQLSSLYGSKSDDQACKQFCILNAWRGWPAAWYGLARGEENQECAQRNPNRNMQ